MTPRSIPLSTLVAGIIFCTLLCINSDHGLQTNAAAVPNAGLETDEGKSYTNHRAYQARLFSSTIRTYMYRLTGMQKCSPEIITIGPLESFTLGFASAACSSRGSNLHQTRRS